MSDSPTATIDCLEPVRDDLLGRTGCQAVAWSGRAATALYWALRLAARRRGVEAPEVILTGMSCSTPAHAALLAGLRTRFADIDPATGLIDPASVRRLVNDNTVAVVAIHLYGETIDLDELVRLCRESDIALIEDIVHALGGSLPDGQLAGSRGDYVVCGFNPPKILTCGGGALLIRNAEEVEVFEADRREDPAPRPLDKSAESDLNIAYRNLYHAYAGLMRLGGIPDAHSAFMAVEPLFQGLWRRPLTTARALARAYPRIQDVLDSRRQRAEVYAQLLEGGPWDVLTGWRSSGVCWRLTFLLDDPSRQTEFSENLRSKGFHVSNLYWPPNLFFNPGDSCPNALGFARRVVNLFLDDGLDADYGPKCAEAALRTAEETGLV